LTSRKKVVIAGASGLVGVAAVNLFSSRDDWDVVAISRRSPAVLGRARYVGVDLLDRAQCEQVLGAMNDVTHLVYTAVNERTDDIVAGWSDKAQIDRNEAMLANVMDPILKSSRGFQQVSLIHGAKAYGTHLPHVHLPLPTKETLPRIPYDNFYYRQEDYVRARQQGQSWAWTVFRPVMICGEATGANMNSFMVLAVMAALRKEAGLDLPTPIGRSLITDATDADLIAQGTEWAASAPTARNETFNIANGDLFALYDAFPVYADAIGLPLGEPTRYDCIAETRRLAHLWPGMVRKYGLNAPASLDEMLGTSLQLAGGWTYDMGDTDPLRYGLVSTIKLRQAGFNGCIDTMQMIRKFIRRAQELKLLPPR
jgi:nucleoside-diphosphate-sugar epimerase